MFCCVVSSSLLKPPSDSALKGSADDSSSGLWKDSVFGGGDVRARDGGEKSPSSLPDVAECGDIIRTVLLVLDLVTRGISRESQQWYSLKVKRQLRCTNCKADLYLWG